MIFAIGDSHAGLFNGYDGNYGSIIQPQYGYCYKIKDDKFISLREHNPFLKKDPNFISIRTGANTAFNMITKISLIDEIIKEYKVDRDKDTILFCYGEIDVRIHIGAQEDQGISLDEVIENLTQRYLDFVNHYKEKGFNVNVWGIIPAGKSGMKAHHRYIKPEDRNKVSKLLNDSFEKRCQQLGINFISIWEELVNEEDYFDYFLDSIHLNYLPCKKLIYEKFNL